MVPFQLMGEAMCDAAWVQLVGGTSEHIRIQEQRCDLQLFPGQIAEVKSFTNPQYE